MRSLGRRQGFLPIGRQLLFQGFLKVRFRQTKSQAFPDRAAQIAPRQVLQARPADRRGAGGHLRVSVPVLADHPRPFQVRIRPSHHLRMRQQLLGEGAVLTQPPPHLERPRRHVRHDLHGDLLMNRHRGIMLYVDHGSLMLTPFRSRFNRFLPFPLPPCEVVEKLVGRILIAPPGGEDALDEGMIADQKPRLFSLLLVGKLPVYFLNGGTRMPTPSASSHQAAV